MSESSYENGDAGGSHGVSQEWTKSQTAFDKGRESGWAKWRAKHGMQMGESGFGTTHGCGCGSDGCSGCEKGRHDDR